MTDRQWIPTPTGTYNTHMGRAIEGKGGGDLGWLLRTFPGVVIWSLQELPSRRALIRALRAAGVRRHWRVLSPPDDRPGHSHVIVRRQRFKVLKVSGPWMRSRFARARTTVVLDDRKTRRLVAVSAVHVDPLGQGFAAQGDSPAGRAHTRQIERHTEWLGSWSDRDEAPRAFAARAEDAVVIAEGDFNESLGEAIQFDRRSELGRRTATALLEEAGLQPTHRLASHGSRAVHLDEVFVRRDPWVRVMSREVTGTPSPHADHKAVVARVSVARLS